MHKPTVYNLIASFSTTPFSLFSLSPSTLLLSIINMIIDIFGYNTYLLTFLQGTTAYPNSTMLPLVTCCFLS